MLLARASPPKAGSLMAATDDKFHYVLDAHATQRQEAIARMHHITNEPAASLAILTRFVQAD